MNWGTQLRRLAVNTQVRTVDLSSVKKGEIDHLLVFLTACLVAIGIVMVYSSSNMLAYELYDKNSYHYIKVQLIACLLGFMGMYVCSHIPYQYYHKYAKLLLLLSISSLFLVFTPFGRSVSSGTGLEFHRWLRIGKFQFQPVEFTKIALVMYVSHFLTQKHNQIHSLTRGVLPNVFILSFIFVLLYKQPDFGSAVLLSLVVVTLLFVGGARPSQIILLIVLAGFFVYASIKGDMYKMQRFHDFWQSLKTPYSSGYQLTQSLNALALGGLFGVGIGNSVYKLFYLPYPHTDFIFAILGEEFGFIGCVSVIALFMLFLWRGIYISLSVENRFASLVAIGITANIGLQTFVNMGVVTGVLPTKGITLPFISYGGSSLTMSLLSVGILLNISREMGTEKRGIRD